MNFHIFDRDRSTLYFFTALGCCCQAAVVIIPDRVEDRHLFDTVIKYIQVFEQKGWMGFLLVGLQVGEKGVDGGFGGDLRVFILEGCDEDWSYDGKY